MLLLLPPPKPLPLPALRCFELAPDDGRPLPSSSPVANPIGRSVPPPIEDDEMMLLLLFPTFNPPRIPPAALPPGGFANVLLPWPGAPPLPYPIVE
jgi:hypothetical protein